MSSNDKQPQPSSPCYAMPPKVIKCEIQAPPPLRPVISCNPKFDEQNSQAQPEPKLNENNDEPKD